MQIEEYQKKLECLFVRCKNCGTMILEQDLHNISLHCDNRHYQAKWCLCNECITKSLIEPCPVYKVKNHIRHKQSAVLLKEKAEIILRYMLNSYDDFYFEEEYNLMKTFLDKDFEYGGTIAEIEAELYKKYDVTIDKSTSCIGELWKPCGVYQKGVYIIVLLNSFQEIHFEKTSKAGRFKGKDPTVSLETLKDNWVDGAEILYIGKTDRTIQKRMQEHIDFWNGKPIAAWGGRLIAQIQNFKDLEMWFLPWDSPTEMETVLINEFKSRHKRLPFANLKC